MSFFTVGEDECRAWSIARGTQAQLAAGEIHSDIQRGFIRAEVVAYDALTTRGSMAVCREHGEVRLEGKEYIVQDGDIINFRFRDACETNRVWLIPSTVSIVIPALDEERLDRRGRHAACAPRRPGAKCIVDRRRIARRDRRSGREQAGARVIRPPLQEGQRGRGQDGDPPRVRRLRPDRRRRRPASARRRPPHRRIASASTTSSSARAAPRRRRRGAARRQRGPQLARQLPHGTADSGSHVGLPRAPGATCSTSSCTCCRTASRRRRPPRWRSCGPATTWRSSRSTRGRGRGARRCAWPATGRNSS